MYALKVTCKEARCGVPNNPVITKAGSVVWVKYGEFGWESSHDLDSRVVTFESKEKADEEAKKWLGQPWYFTPEKVEVVEIQPIYKRLIAGYQEKR